MGKNFDHPPRSESRSTGTGLSTVSSGSEVSRVVVRLSLPSSPILTCLLAHQVTDAAQRMLWYPVAYGIALMPLAIAAFVAATTLHVSSSLSAFIARSSLPSHPLNVAFSFL